MKILLVEDNPDDVFFIRQQFSEIALDQSPLPKVELLTAELLQDSISLVTSRPVDLVLLDLGLADSQGLDTVKSMMGAAGDIPVIVMTGHDDRQTARAALAAGAQDYLVKGEFTTETLQRAVVYATERAALQRQLRELAVVRESEQLVLRQSRVLEAINTVLHQSITCNTEQELAMSCMAVAEEITGSAFGFIGEVNRKGGFSVMAMTDPGWAACSMDTSQAVNALRNLPVRGLWGAVIREARPLITNDPAAHPDSAGVPEGHPEITSFMGVPLLEGPQGVGVIALANKRGGYTREDREAIEALSRAFIESLHRFRSEQALKESQQRFSRLFEHSPISLWEEDCSLVKERLDSLQREGIDDLRDYFAAHPRFVRECASLVRITNVNQASLDIYGARSKQELMKNIGDTFVEASYDVFAEEMAVLAGGSPIFSSEAVTRRLTGEENIIRIRLTIMPGSENTWERVLVTIADITAAKEAEERIHRHTRLTEGINTLLLESMTCDTRREVAEKFLTAAIRITGCSFGLFSETGVSGGHLDPLALSDPPWGDPPGPDGPGAFMVRLLKCLENTTVRDILAEGQQSLIIEDGELSPAVNGDAGGRFTVMVYPMRHWGVTTGIIVLARTRDTFSSWDREVIEVLSVAFSTAIDRKRVEMALRESEEKFRSTITHAAEGVVLMDVGRTIVEANPAFATLLGYGGDPITLSSLVGEPFDRFGHPEDRESDRCMYDELLASSRDFYRLEKRFVRRDGEVLWGHLTVSTVRSTGGSLLYLVGMLQDISERKAAEDAMMESEKRFRRLIAHQADGLLVINTDGLVQVCNTSAETILGASRGKLIGTRLEIPALSEDRAEIHLGEKDGRIIVDLRSVDVTWLGRPARLVSMRDITELKKTQRELTRTVQTLARTNREMEEFTYIASHDLQEPLRKIMVFGDRLVQDDAGALSSRGKTYLERMVSAASRMRVLIMRLLDYSRVSTETRKFVPVYLNGVLDTVCDDLEISIVETAAVIKRDDLPPVKADPVQMHQLFQNLLGNAIKYRRPEVPPEVIISTVVEDGGMVAITVADNGIGIDENKLEEIMKPFHRLHHRDEYEGVGIGLSICGKIVERHGGTLTVQSVSGRGSAFMVTLPGVIWDSEVVGDSGVAAGAAAGVVGNESPTACEGEAER